MDDFGNLIVDFHCAGLYGFAAFVLCAECNLAPLFASEQYLAQIGVVV
jgi:hypothetical protein